MPKWVHDETKNQVVLMHHSALQFTNAVIHYSDYSISEPVMIY